MVLITRLRLLNFRGLKTLDAEIPPKGVIVKGRNGAGKGTVLKAIGAALAAEGANADAIRIGEKEGEVLIDLDRAGESLRARRRFTPTKSELVVTRDPDTDHAEKLDRPTTQLAEMLGDAPIDVIKIVLEKDKAKRRELIMKALPVRVTVEQLKRWIPGLPEDYNVSGHGLEVIARLRGSAYDRRTAANKAAKEAAAEAERAHDTAARARASAPKNAGELEPASVAHREAVRRHHDAESRFASAQAARERMSGVQEKIDERRKAAADLRASLAARPTAEAIAAAREQNEVAFKKYKEIERQLQEARDAYEATIDPLDTLIDAEKKAAGAEEKAAAIDADVATLEATLAGAIDPITEADVKAAATAEYDANTAVQDAALLASAKKFSAEAEEASKKAEAARAEAERLDNVVRQLTVEAPAAILKESGGVEGLTIDGDTVRLNGVDLDHCCGAQKVVFAAEIAKALSKEAGFIIVDELERLDRVQLEAFVEAATAGGRQLIGSLVDPEAGDLVLVHLEASKDSTSTEAA